MVTGSPPGCGERIGPLPTNTFEQMIPEIRRLVQAAFRGVESPQRDTLVNRGVANAFDIFARLVECGLKDLAYPKPLAMAALARLRLLPDWSMYGSTHHQDNWLSRDGTPGRWPTSVGGR